MNKLEYLREFCETETQQGYLDAIIAVGDDFPSNKAADHLGIHRRNLQDGIARLKKKAALKGLSPENQIQTPQPEGFAIKATSVLYGADGEVKLSWVKNNLEQEKQGEALKEFAISLSEYITPVKPTPPTPTELLDPLLLSMLILGDAHYGSRSSKGETRASDMDLPKAIKLTHKAIDDLIDRSPMAKHGMFVSVGDAMHAANSNNTTHSGTPLDTACTLEESLRAIAVTIRHAIDRMLGKFSEVSVVIAAGNHDKDMSVALRMMIEFVYEDEPRVSVLTSPTAYHYVGWGKHMWMFHHGDKLRGEKLVALAAKHQPKLWGNSKANSRLAIMGHIHHMTKQEFGGMTVESFGCLLPVDKWHAESGYGSSRNMQCLTFRKEGGRHSTIIHEIDDPEDEPDLSIL